MDKRSAVVCADGVRNIRCRCSLRRRHTKPTAFVRRQSRAAYIQVVGSCGKFLLLFFPFCAAQPWRLRPFVRIGCGSFTSTGAIVLFLYSRSLQRTIHCSVKNTPLLLDKPPAVCYHNKRAHGAGAVPAQRRRRKEGRIRKSAMETIRNRTFDEERALYGARGLTVADCRFDGRPTAKAPSRRART